MYHYEITENIGSQVENTTVVYLEALWQRHRDTRRRLPRLGDLSPSRLDWCAADLMVVEQVDSDDFLYLHYGAHIVAASGFDMTGKRVSEFRSEVGQFFAEKYRQCVAAGQVLYTVHAASHAPTVFTWERLLLPVSDGPRRLIVVYNRPMTFRHEFLQGVLETTTNGIVALSALHAPAGGIEDFHVVCANRAACDMLATDSRSLLDSRLSEGFPSPFVADIAGLAAKVYATGEPAVLEIHGMRNGVHRYLELGAARVRDGVTLAVTDVTPLRRQAGELAGLEQRLEREVDARRRQESGLAVPAGALTALHGQGRYQERLAAEVARAARHGRDLALLLLALDHLDIAMASQGREAGDGMLATTAQVCADSLRTSDFLGRWGDESFGVCLPETRARAAGLAAERLAGAVARAFSAQAMLSMRVTASVGAAQLRHGEAPDDLLARAGQALHAARTEGGNRVVVVAP